MKDLNPFIKELLFSNDCVILPGFGGFIGNYTPARIDRESHTFYPPVKSISFNSKLSHNDGLLIGKISEKKDMGYADAKNLVETYIGQLRDKLQKGERVHLDDIGHFQLNGEGGIQFEPENNVNYLLDSYGLSPFTREPVEDYDISKAISRSRERDPIIIANRRRMVWRAAVALPFVLALVIVPLKSDLFRSEAGLNPLARVEIEEIRSAQEALFREMPLTNRENVLNKPDEKSAARADETAVAAEPLDRQAAIEQPVKDRDAEVKPMEAGTVDQQATATRGAGVYYLVVGSFGDATNANRHLKDLATRGYNAELLKASNGYYRVCAESFASIEEAKNAHSAMSEDFPGIWIWKR
ncbi:MAG: SPOR domain-containing protein [Bacteroidales bacterium]|nr:SPOR domain-containing protein [Bacteroidales bacterium]